MTDEELIARLRDERMSTGALYGDLADRIEQLLQSNEALMKARREDALELLAASGQAQEAYEAQLKAEARAERLEAALRGLMVHEPDYPDTIWQEARSALEGTEHE